MLINTYKPPQGPYKMPEQRPNQELANQRLGLSAGTCGLMDDIKDGSFRLERNVYKMSAASRE